MNGKIIIYFTRVQAAMERENESNPLTSSLKADNLGNYFIALESETKNSFLIVLQPLLTL